MAPVAKEIEARFDEVYASLGPHRRGDGFVSYAELTRADTRKLAREIDALAELLSQAPAHRRRPGVAPRWANVER
jgi:iron uptake system component EfeO